MQWAVKWLHHATCAEHVQGIPSQTYTPYTAAIMYNSVVERLSHTTGQEAPDPPTHILSPWFCYSQCCFCCAVLTCDITHITLVQLQHPGRGVAAGADNPNGTGHTQLRCVQCTKHHPPSCHATGATFTHKHSKVQEPPVTVPGTSLAVSQTPAGARGQ